jgi:hypothetical protein
MLFLLPINPQLRVLLGIAVIVAGIVFHLVIVAALGGLLALFGAFRWYHKARKAQR